MERLGECGLSDPTGTYRMFDAEMDVDGLGALKPVDATFDLRDSRFSPSGSQEEPELSDAIFDHDTAQLFGCRDMSGLSIQRVDLLQRAVGEFHRIAQDSHLESVAKAKQAMDVINTIADPELTSLAPQVTSALIDGKDTPDFSFRLADELDAERIKRETCCSQDRSTKAWNWPKRRWSEWTDCSLRIRACRGISTRMRNASSTIACSPRKANGPC